MRYQCSFQIQGTANSQNHLVSLNKFRREAMTQDQNFKKENKNKKEQLSIGSKLSTVKYNTF